MKIENVDSLQLYPLILNCDHKIVDSDRCQCSMPISRIKNNSLVNSFSVQEAINLFSIDEKLLIEKINKLKEKHYSGREELWDFQIGVYNIRVKKVICNSIGSTSICKGCGAAKPHDPSSCEPCPVNKNAKCIEAKDPFQLAGSMLMIRKVFMTSDGVKIMPNQIYDIQPYKGTYLIHRIIN